MNKHDRKSIRLRDYDYSSEGGYFITIVTVNREPLFGRILNGNMVLNEFGMIVRDEWLQTALKRKNVEIYEDEFCIMPNHFHAIIWIVKNDKENLAWQGDTTGGHGTPCPYGTKTAKRLGDMARHVPTTAFGKPVAGSLSTIIGGFKSAVTRRINVLRGVEGEMVWQSRFYDHIIRDEKDYYSISEYISLNPAGWEKDENFVKEFG
jgi:putative transposase